MKTRLFIAFSLSIISLAAVTYVTYINYRFSKTTFPSPIKHKPKLWSHRGIGTQYPENSIEAFEQAIFRKAEGIEIDVYYQPDKRKLCVTHDPPKPDSSYLALDQIISRFRDTIFYWIDLKNLNVENAAEIASQLQSFSQKFSLKEKLFIESVEAKPLNRIQSAGVKTIYWLQYNRLNPVKKYLKKIYLKKILYSYQFDGVSTASMFYDADFKESFSPIPAFIFHPEDRERIQTLTKDSNVNVILTDWEYQTTPSY